MTAFRLFCSLCCLLVFCLPFSSFAADPAPAGGGDSQLILLQQENTSLQRQVRRLEHEVSALRDELDTPDATQIIGGIGYIVGLFGLAAWYAAGKKNPRKG